MKTFFVTCAVLLVALSQAYPMLEEEQQPQQDTLLSAVEPLEEGEEMVLVREARAADPQRGGYGGYGHGHGGYGGGYGGYRPPYHGGGGHYHGGHHGHHHHGHHHGHHHHGHYHG